MKKLVMILFLFSAAVLAEGQNSTSEYLSDTPGLAKQPPASDNIFYGGNVNFSLWNKYYYIGLFPMIGYNFTEQFSAGARIGYAYVSDGRLNPTLNSSNYGAGAFLRYKIIPQIYAKAEFIYFSFERAINILPTGYKTNRYDVPMILLGAGYIYQVNRNVSVFAELSFDVLQDSNSPFKSGYPFLSVGAAVGL